MHPELGDELTPSSPDGWTWTPGRSLKLAHEFDGVMRITSVDPPRPDADEDLEHESLPARSRPLVDPSLLLVQEKEDRPDDSDRRRGSWDPRAE
jgi:hypothetical protein